jgi:GTP pyrophosphokinase
MGKTSNSFNNFIEDNEILKEANKLAHQYMSVLKRREKGKTMYHHVFDVAKNVYDAGVIDTDIIAAAFLHDIVEDSEKSLEKSPDLKIPITVEYLKKHFNNNIAHIVENLSNISSQKLEKDYIEKFNLNQNDNVKYQLKRMNYVKAFMKHLLEAVKLNILESLFLIKFFDRYHNMQTLQYHGNAHKQNTIAKETLDIYIPLFYMVHQIPIDYIYDMERIAFHYMYPDIYDNRLRYIEQTKESFQQEYEFLKNYVNDNYENIEVISKERSFYRLHLTKSNFSGINYAINEIIIISKEPSYEEYDKLPIEQSEKIKLDAEKRLYNIMVDLIHLPLKGSKRSNRHYLLQNDAFKYSLNFHYAQAYLRPLPAMRLNLYSNSNKIMFQLNLTTSNKFNAYNERRDIKTWVKDLKEVQEHLVLGSSTKVTYEKLRMDFLKPVTLYTPKGDYYHLPTNATLRDLAFRIHTDLGIRGEYALVNQVEEVKLNKKVAEYHGNIMEIVISEKKKDFEDINFSKIYSEIELASSGKKIDEFVKKYLKENFGENMSSEKLTKLIKIFKKEIEKKYTRRPKRY